jgi:hypothetical protein
MKRGGFKIKTVLIIAYMPTLIVPKAVGGGGWKIF